MSKILSQYEVNTLFQDLKLNKEAKETVLTDTSNISVYDFKHPDWITKDHIRAFKTIHNNFAKSFGTYLSTKLRTTVDLSVLSVDQLTYSEFTMAMASPSCIYICHSEVVNRNFIIEFTPELVFFSIDRLLGGYGDILDENREITIIEENVLKKIAQKAIIQLDESWKQITTLNPRLLSFETNPQFVQIAPASEPSLVISLSVKIQNFNSLITLCFPYFFIEPIIDKLNTLSWNSSKPVKVSQEDAEIVREKLHNTSIVVIAGISTDKVSLKDLLNLEVGDVLMFDKRIDSEFEIKLCGKPKFWARPGISGKYMAFKITDIITTK